MSIRIVDSLTVIPGRAPFAREPGIQSHTRRAFLDSGSRLRRVRNDEDRA
jgi:hypothetical protein